MRRLWILVLLCGCDAARSGNGNDGGRSLDGFFGSDEDLAVSVDLAGVDLAGADFAGADLARAGDLAVDVDLALPGPDGSGVITAGDSCAAAPTLVAGLAYDNQDTTGLTDDYHIGALSNGTCNTNNNVYKGPDATYRINVPNGKTLSVQVQPHNALGAWDPSVAIVADCADGSTCLAGHDDTNLTGDPESVSWLNSSGADKMVFVIVDSYFQTTNNNHGQYSLLALVN